MEANIKKLETKQVSLRPYQKDDFLNVYNSWANDERVFTYLSVTYHETIDETEQMINRYINDYNLPYKFHWAIIDKKTDKIIGDISCLPDPLIDKVMALSYCLGYKYWNKQIMTEVIQEVAKFLFTLPRVNLVKALCNQNNSQSIKVLLKNGFDLLDTVSYLDNQGKVNRLNTFILSSYKYFMTSLTKDIRLYLGDSRIPIYSEPNALCEYISQTDELQVYLMLTIDSDLSANITKLGYCFKDIVKHGIYTYHYLITDNDDSEMLINSIFKKENNIVGYYYYSSDDKSSFNLNHISMLENWLINKMIEKEYTLTAAESCTGGLLISTLINTPGASNVIKGSFIVYTEEMKMKLVDVKNKTLALYTVYSLETSKEMAIGAKQKVEANISISVTGLAGGNTKDINDGLFYYTIIINDKIYSYTNKVEGNRNEIRLKQVYTILKDLWKLLN